MAASPILAPRLLSRAQACAYLQIPWAEMQERIAARLLPSPIWKVPVTDKSARWDRAHIDKALDAAAGPAATVESAVSYLDAQLGTG